MPATRHAVTRGTGLLETYLARLRASQANRLVPAALRGERILDIGCGSYPYFLAHTSFKQKFAIDQVTPATTIPDIHQHTLNLNHHPQLPFADAFFSVITMLAVAEHLDPTGLVILFEETYRTLRPGGRLILTTPAAWSNGLLRWLARFDLVSAQEINEHAYTYTLPLIGWYFGKAGFAMEKARFGYFEMGLNMWAMAER